MVNKTKKSVKSTKAIKLNKRSSITKAEREHKAAIIANARADVYDCSVWLERLAAKTKSKADHIVIEELFKILEREASERHLAKTGFATNASING